MIAREKSPSYQPSVVIPVPIKAFVISVLVMLPVLTARAENTAPLIKPEQLGSIDLIELANYRCPNGEQCGVVCRAGEGQASLDRRGVKRLSYGKGKFAWIVATINADPVGKLHRAEAHLPVPVSCVFDNLENESVTPVVNGQLVPESRDDEVIFELSPSS